MNSPRRRFLFGQRFRTIGGAAATLLALALFGSAGLQAGTISFTFTGTCSDCSNPLGTLILNDTYVLGNSLTNGDFVSFTYTSSVITPPMIITTANLLSISGTIQDNLPNYEQLLITDTTFQLQFNSTSGGNWCAGSKGGCLDDVGNQGMWILDSPAGIPEPSGVILVPAGVGALALLLRRRNSNRHQRPGSLN